MTAKRFTDVWCSETGHIGFTDNGIDKEFTGSEFEDFLNELYEENYELKEVIEEVFEMITNLDYVRGQYLNGLLDVLGEENDVDKTKERIKEFLE